MKTILSLALSLFLVSAPGMAQTSSIDDIFSKFDGHKNVTTVNVSKDMMNLASQMDSSDFKAKNLFAQISSVRILAFEQASQDEKNLFNSMVNSLNLNEYKELMEVHHKNQTVKMLTRENQGKISDFLLFVTGEGNPVLIRIQGNIDPKEIGKLSSCSNFQGMNYLALLKEKK